MIDLGTLGGTESIAQAINVHGEVIGFADTASGEEEGFLWRDGVMMSLGDATYPSDISDAGHIVGTFATRRENTRPFLMIDSSAPPIDLGTHGGEYGKARGVNSMGHAVGSAWNESRRYLATLWRGGDIIDLGSLAGLGGYAMAINEAGQVVGSSSMGGFISHAFLWEEGVGMIDLGVLPEAGKSVGVYGPLLVSTTALDVNAHGQVVGYSDPAPVSGDPGRPGPWLWEDGAMVNLNDMIDPATGWEISSVGAINDAGQIAATARPATGGSRLVLLEPVCGPDCDGSGALDFFDFLCFQNQFAAGDPRADCDASEALDFFDFLCFQNSFAAGCD
jgi:probable HAF family extracellular repeat protein